MWPALSGLGGRPLLVLRGAYSDILSAATCDRMKEVVPGTEIATVAGVGHAPRLDEPESVAAIDRLLERVADNPPLRGEVAGEA